LAATLVAALAGCAGLHLAEPPIEDANITAPRDDRQQEMVEDFERRRDLAQYQSAVASWERGDVAGCEALLLSLLARNPNNREARLLLVELYMERQDVAAAEQQLQTLLDENPDDAQTHHAMGLMLEATGRVQEAMVYFRQATQLAPNNRFYAASCRDAEQHDGTRNDAAVSGVPGSAASPACPQDSAPDRLIEIANTGQARGLLQEAAMALEAGRNADVLSLLQGAVAAEPDNPRIPIAASVHLLQYNQTDAAIALLGDALAIHADSAALYRILATAQHHGGDYESAQAALLQALSLDDSNALTYYLMGCTLHEMGQTEAAAANFEQALRLDPRYAAP